jgi:nicotinamide mononucleotide (NMN) deamidase PncC
MSWGGVIPAWLLAADGVINQYAEGRLDYDRAKAKLEALGVPDTMMKRLDEIRQKEQ